MEPIIRVLKNEEIPMLKKYLKKDINLKEFDLSLGGCFIVCEYDNKIIGYAIAINNNIIFERIERGNLANVYIYVEEKYRRKLIGTKLAYNLYYNLLVRDYNCLHYVFDLNESNLNFLHKVGFSISHTIDYNMEKKDFFKLNLFDFFKNQIKLYSLEYNRYKCLSTLPYIYNDDEISDIIAVLLSKKVINEGQLRFEKYNRKIDDNESLQTTKNNQIREELLRRKVEKARMIIEEAKKLNVSDLMSFNASDLLKIREDIIRKKEEKYNKKTICADGGSSSNKARKKRFEKYEKDKDFEKKILEEAKKDMVYTNEVFELIENYMRLYSLTHTDFMERSGISRKTYSKIKLDQTNPDKKTIMQICIGLGLEVDHAKLLMKAAGFAFSRSNDIDVIVYKCLEHGVCYISEVNDILVMADYEDKLFNNHLDYDSRKKKKKKSK